MTCGLSVALTRLFVTRCDVPSRCATRSRIASLPSCAACAAGITAVVSAGDHGQDLSTRNPASVASNPRRSAVGVLRVVLKGTAFAQPI